MNGRISGSCVRVLSAALGLVILATPAMANEPPTPEQIAQYKADGTWAQRVAAAYAIGNHKAAPGLAARTHWRVQQLARQAAGLPELREPPPSAQGGIPSTGSPNILVILVEFPADPNDSNDPNGVGYPHYPNQTQADVYDKFFQDGDGNFPYESIRNYYERASYNALHLQGNVLGWYMATHPRSYYEALDFGQGQETLFMEALNYYDTQGHDFTQYDNDGDGVLDSVYVKWTGPRGAWSSFWWAYQYSWWANPSYTIDGKYLGTYVWSYISHPEGTDYNPRTDIHETGHALGLPDYYDYDGDVGPDGGVGGLEMMHDNTGDWNCFSKFMVEWLTPTTIVAGSQTLTLNPSGTSQDCVLIMPGATPGEIFDEYFMVQYRKAGEGNDASPYPTGLAIWHIDATLDTGGWDFEYNNSYTDHKLLRRMEADGLEEIETGDGDADQGDFYLPADVFGPLTSPNSDDYTPAASNVLVYELSEPDATMTANFGFYGAGSTGSALLVEGCDPANQAIDPGETVTVSLSLENLGGTSTTNLVGTLLATGGVTNPDGPYAFGAIAPGATATQSFTFTATGDCGGSLTATLQLQDGADTYAPVTYTFALGALRLSESFESVIVPALPTSWTATRPVGTAPLWATAASDAHTSPNSAYVADPNEPSDNRMTSAPVTIESAGAQLTFWHRYGLDDGYDGGRLEISIAGGTFEDILAAGGTFVSGAYTAVLPSSGYSNPLEGEAVWSGSSGGFVETVVDLPATTAGNSVEFRWRLGSDYSVGDAGWWVDSIRILGDNECCESAETGACCVPNFGTAAIDCYENVTEAECQTYAQGVWHDGLTCAACTCWGDLDSNGSIGLSDLAQLLAAYNQTGKSYWDGDMSGEGAIDLSDLAALLAVYNTTCP